MDKALVNQVEQSARCGHYNVHSALEGCHLFALLDTAENDGVLDGHVLGIVLNALSNLGRKLTSGAQN